MYPGKQRFANRAGAIDDRPRGRQSAMLGLLPQCQCQPEQCKSCWNRLLQRELLKEKVPRFTGERIRGAGQYIQEEQPGAVLAAVARLEKVAK